MIIPQARVLLFGAGSIGTCYAYLLEKAGLEVTAVCRSNYEAVKDDGFTLNSGVFGNGIRFKPRIVRSIEEATSSGKRYNYIVIATKAFPSPTPEPIPSAAAAAIAPAVTKGFTAIVLIQNGIGIEQEFKDAYPDNTLLSCVVYLPATQTSPGVVEMGDVELLQIGPYPAGNPFDLEHAKALQKFLWFAEATAEVFEDIQEMRWRKLLLNCWNSICALSQSRDVPFLEASDEAEDFVRQTMLEVAAVAQQVGYPNVNEKSVEKQIYHVNKRLGTKGMEPSMLADAIQGRRMEVEAIIGNVMRIGKEKGVAVVRLEALYVLTKALDCRIAAKMS